MLPPSSRASLPCRCVLTWPSPYWLRLHRNVLILASLNLQMPNRPCSQVLGTRTSTFFWGTRNRWGAAQGCLLTYKTVPVRSEEDRRAAPCWNRDEYNRWGHYTAYFLPFLASGRENSTIIAATLKNVGFYFLSVCLWTWNNEIGNIAHSVPSFYFQLTNAVFKTP